MAREPIAVDLLPRNFAVGTGASVFIGVTALPGQEAITVRYVSGGTVAIVNLPAAIGYSAGYLLPLTDLKFDLSGTFWLQSSGATSIVQVIHHRSQGFEGATLGYNGTN